MAENFQVVDQRQTTDIGPGGRFRQVIEVTAVTAHGVEFTETFDLFEYENDDLVKARLAARAESIDRKFAL